MQTSTVLSLFVYRLMSSLGELYYLLLVPLVFLYVAIFLSNKLQSHQQQRQQQQRQLTHSTAARSRHSAAPPLITDISARLARLSSASSALERFSPSSSHSSPSPLPSRSLSLPPSPRASLSSAQRDAAERTREEEETQPSLASDVDASAPLTLRFLLPDHSIVSHSFPSDPALEVSAVLSALYPADAALMAASRLIYQGRVLRPETALAEYELSNDDVVHVHHIAVPASLPAATLLLSSAELAAAPPPLLLLLLSVMAALLGAGWGAYWSVGERLFDVASTLLLLCLSSLSAAGVLLGFALQRPPPPPHAAAVAA